MFTTLHEFYCSKEWQNLRKQIILERISKTGDVIDEVTGKPIVYKYDIILHHKIPLTESNVNDYNISLNPDNIQIVSHQTHNKIHHRFGTYTRHIYLVYGSPCSGKSEFVNASAGDDDLVIDLDKIYDCIGTKKYPERSAALTGVAIRTRDLLIDSVKTRNGKWSSAYIVGGYPMKSDRERLVKELGAELIFIEKTKEQCYEKAQERKANTQYIDDWFLKFQP